VAKKITKVVKIDIEAGKATPAPPVGTIFGPLGINLQDFCSKYNEATREKMGDIIPAEVTVFEDRSFSFILKTPPTSSLLLKAANIQKGSPKGANQVVATISKDDLKKIAEIKLPDLNAYDIDEAMEIIEGTARNMGIAIKGVNDAELAEQGLEAKKAEEEAAKLESELEEMEANAKAMAEAEVPEVESSEQAEEAKDENEEEKEEK
jgi:large subunit ribosomal protein L11